MQTIVFFPIACLKKLDRLGISYTTGRTVESVVEADYDPHSSFCDITVSKEDYKRVYEIGCNEHKRMLMAAYGNKLNEDIHND